MRLIESKTMNEGNVSLFSNSTKNVKVTSVQFIALYVDTKVSKV